MEGLIAALRLALRQFVRRPGFALIVILVLGLGIGLNTALFSIVDAVLIRPLPYPEAKRLVLVFGTVPERDVTRGWTSPLNYVDVADRNRSLVHLAAWQDFQTTLSGEANARRLSGTQVTADFFRVFQTEATVGRTFASADDQPGSDPVVILSHALWQRQFGADPEVVGRATRLDGEPAVVVGVMPPAFDFPAGTELWRPLRLVPDSQDRGSHNLSIIGLLAEGFGLQEGQQDLSAVAHSLGEDYPETNGNRGFAVVPLKQELVGDTQQGLRILSGAVALVLLIACANIANLLLARTAGRETEIAMRSALGAQRGQILWQLLAEYFVLAMGAAVAGLLIGYWGSGFLARLAPAGIPRLADAGLDPRAVAFTLALGVLTLLLFGLVPALRGSRPNLQGALKDGGNQGVGRGRHRLLNALVVAEITISLTLMIGAGLLIKSFLGLSRVDPGFVPDRVLTLNVAPPAWKYNAVRALDLYERLLERVTALPGVESAAAVMSRPIRPENSWSTGIEIEGRASDPDDSSNAVLNPVTTEYFKTLGIPLIAGRAFATTDDLNAPGVAILSQAAARLYFPGEDPIGKIFTHALDLGPSVATRRTILGVVGDVRHAGLASDEEPIIYVPYRQMPFPRLSLMVKTANDPLSYVAPIRQAIWEIDEDVPLEESTTMGAIVDRSLSEPKLYMTLLGAFAAVALVLAAVGVYGVLSHLVVQRHREIGVRVALGARRRKVLSLIVGQALYLAAIGIVLGLVGSLLLSRLITSLLFDVESNDPVTYLITAGVLIGSVVLASLLPALRATRFDPVKALRSS
ncbi:MAG: ABC transporter permease [Acidobacteriota bacterium]